MTNNEPAILAIFIVFRGSNCKSWYRKSTTNGFVYMYIQPLRQKFTESRFSVNILQLAIRHLVDRGDPCTSGHLVLRDKLITRKILMRESTRKVI
jgi:hypothetical protein